MGGSADAVNKGKTAALVTSVKTAYSLLTKEGRCLCFSKEEDDETRARSDVWGGEVNHRSEVEAGEIMYAKKDWRGISKGKI